VNLSDDDLAPLLRAAHDGRLDAVRGRLDAGLDVNSTDGFDYGLLHAAVSGGQLALVDLLLERGADPNRRGGSNGRSALHYAAVEADAPIVARLLAAGADVHLRTRRSGQTVLMAAALTRLNEDGQEAIVRLLCGAGADARAVAGEHWTPLHYAAFDNKPGIARALLAAGAEVGAAAENGWTPLHVAAPNVALAIATVLLQAGARADARSTAPGSMWEHEYPAGVTPLDVAKTPTPNQPPSKEMIALLERYLARRQRMH
jgi:ankyrin repeat protein